jgi:neurofibromin 1
VAQLCAKLHAGVAAKFPASPRVGVAGFFFLRFVCPALVAPEQLGLPSPPSAEARRGLVLVAKVLQNAASGVLFKKEPFMLPLNDFVGAAAVRLGAVYDRIVTAAPGVTETPRADDIAADMSALHRYTFSSLPLSVMIEYNNRI